MSRMVCMLFDVDAFTNCTPIKASSHAHSGQVRAAYRMWHPPQSTSSTLQPCIPYSAITQALLHSLPLSSCAPCSPAAPR